nr:immunoglobulin heavy chain junction region [Macaca mulatta]
CARRPSISRMITVTTPKSFDVW